MPPDSRAPAANFMAPSYNPDTKLFYFAVREQCDVYYKNAPVYIEGRPYLGKRHACPDGGAGMGGY